MLQTRVRKALFGFAVAGAAALGAAGPAQAAVYSGTWDPPYGAWFPDLNWAGNIEIFIPDSCLLGGTGVVSSGACAGMTAGFADVVLSSLATPSSSETLNFNEKVAVSQVSFVGGVLSWVDSAFFTPVQASIPAAGGGDYYFSLKDTQYGPRLFHLRVSTFDKHTDTTGEGHEMHGKGYGYGHADSCDFPPSITKSDQNCGFSDTYGQVTYTLVAIPEPQTYALMLAGLGVMGFVARRRRR